MECSFYVLLQPYHTHLGTPYRIYPTNMGPLSVKSEFIESSLTRGQTGQTKSQHFAFQDHNSIDSIKFIYFGDNLLAYLDVVAYIQPGLQEKHKLYIVTPMNMNEKDIRVNVTQDIAFLGIQLCYIW